MTVPAVTRRRGWYAPRYRTVRPLRRLWLFRLAFAVADYNLGQSEVRADAVAVGGEYWAVAVI